MENEFLYPSKVSHRISELTSVDVSNETKANVARWYAEMMIKEFLHEYFDDESYKNESLNYLVGQLKGKVSKEIIDSILLIKQYGDRASHYHPEKGISAKQSRKTVEEALKLYELIIIDVIKKKSLYAHPDRASLVSVLLPQTRVSIYNSLIDFDSYFINQDLLKKWCIACVKNRQENKARNKLMRLLKRELIEKYDYDDLISLIKVIKLKMDNDELPIPRNRADFARNLHDLLANHLSDESKLENYDLIKVLMSMAENVVPSEMKHYKGMQVFTTLQTVYE
ncbi:TPA: hypothetical protein ACPJ0R_001201 [Vibrio diabolicus]